MMEKKPEVRFREFEGEWNMAAFGDLYQNTIEKNDISFGIEKNITVATMQFKPDITISNDNYLRSYNICRLGDIVFEGHKSNEFRYGRFVENDIGDGIVSHIFSVFRPISDCDLNFWKYYIHNEQVMRPLLMRSTKSSTMMHDLVVNDILKEKILVPIFPEQRRIGALFATLDRRIDTVRREYEKLRQTKKAMLAAMFPMEGENVPRVRFREFTGEWEKLSAGDIFVEYTDKGHPGLPILAASQELGMIRRDEAGINFQHDKASEATYKRVLPGQFVIHLRSFQGGFAHSTIEGIASPAYTIFEFRDKGCHYDFFWRYIFTSEHFIKRLREITYGIRDGRSISTEEFWNMKFFVPSFDEQRRIGSFFQNLGRLIEIRRKKLTKLQDLKKALLAKMFV